MENNCFLIRYGELFLKGKNKYFFESLLQKNIKFILKDIPCKFNISRNRFIVEEFNKEYFSIIKERLTDIFGIHSISPAIKIKTNQELIIKTAFELCPKEGAFRISVNRADKKFNINSMAFSALIGAELLKQNPNLKVNLYNFDYNIQIDIRENGFSYIFFERLKAVGGLPVGSSGKGLLLLSGGIDSPVAGYMMAKRGMKLCAVHYESYPYTSEAALQKVRDLGRIISKYNLGLELFIVPFTDIQFAIHNNCPQEYMITIMRRFMMRIAEKLSIKTNCKGIITGESLGQVASQTIEGLITTDNAINKLPVLRPLIGFDKVDTIELSKKIGAFEISILPYEDCCTVFLPQKPIIHPKLENVIKYEQSLDINTLIKNAVDNSKMEII